MFLSKEHIMYLSAKPQRRLNLVFSLCSTRCLHLTRRLTISLLPEVLRAYSKSSLTDEWSMWETECEGISSSPGRAYDLSGLLQELQLRLMQAECRGGGARLFCLPRVKGPTFLSQKEWKWITGRQRWFLRGRVEKWMLTRSAHSLSSTCSWLPFSNSLSSPKGQNTPYIKALL